MVRADIRGWPAAGTSPMLPIDPSSNPEIPAMTATPGLTLLGLLLVLVSIPLALSVGPLVIGAIVLVVAARRAHRGLSPVV